MKGPGQRTQTPARLPQAMPWGALGSGGESCLCTESGQRGSRGELSCVQLGRVAASRETAQERPGRKTLGHRACPGASLAVPPSRSDAFCSDVFNGPEAAAVRTGPSREGRGELEEGVNLYRETGGTRRVELEESRTAWRGRLGDGF